jgi:4-amino-4-deoxy-L-arabinose transferase-like glycosyltransferase
VRARAQALVFVLAVIAWTAYVHRPLDYRIRSPWRQADYTGIARSFAREGMDIRYPRIDWRGAGPGYVEGEFPLVPWTGALLLRAFGDRTWLLRLPPLACTIASLFVFYGLARKLLPPAGVLFATAAFAANPLVFHLATAIQPDALLVLLALVAAGACWRWGDRPESTGRLLVAAAAIAGAILAKAPAAYLGFVLAWEVLRREGLRGVLRARVWLAAAVALGPPLAWYAWAYHFWTTYGNSLGLSNGDHFLTLKMLVPPRFLVGILKWETLGVFTPAGWLLAAAAVAGSARRAERPLVWYAAAWIFYLAAAKTTSADWAYYYHANTVAPGCLLMGAGLAAIAEGRVLPSRWAWVGPVLGAATVGTLVLLVGYYIHLRDGRDDLRPMWECSRVFARFVPPDGLLVVAGSSDEGFGWTGAYNVSMPFAWMDRRGFNYPENRLSIEALDRIAAAGGRWWMASAAELAQDDLHDRVERKYRLVASCGSRYFLYDLAPR